MSKYYVEAFDIDGGDEFNVYFFDIYTETQRNNINGIGDTFPGLQIGYAFGSNENFDADEGFEFHISGIEASEQEVATLKKFGIQAESLLSAYEDGIGDHLDKETREQGGNQYQSCLNVPEEIFQSYPFKLGKYDYIKENE